MKLIDNAAAITKAIVSIQGRGAKLDGDIHVAGVSVLAHAAQHRDATLADRLVNAMPKGGRKLALVEWMLAHGQIAKLDAKVDKEAIAAGRLFKIDDTRTLDLKGAMETSWVEFKKEKDVLTAFDAQAAVKSVLQRMTKAVQAGTQIDNRAAALADAKALVAALEVPVNA